MKKEIGIAIVIGFILGLIITFGIWTANKSIKENASTQKEETLQNVVSKEEKSPTIEEKLTLKILSPENNALVNEAKIKITGKTLPNINIVILSEENENILQSDEQGQFIQEITLASGTNEIKISAFDNNGAETNTTLDLVYSKSEI
jgi:hypothetical protein